MIVLFAVLLLPLAFWCGLEVRGYVDLMANKPQRFSWWERRRLERRATDHLYAELEARLKGE